MASAQKRNLQQIQSVNIISPHKASSMLPITFTSADFKAIDLVQDDAVVISVEITNCIVRKTLVDQGSLVDILFWNTFRQLDIPDSELLPHDDPLFDFTREIVGTKECTWLYTKFNHEQPQQRGLKTQYVIVHAYTSYNILLGCLSLNALGVIVSTPHLAMKFPSNTRSIITIHADQRITRECYMESLKLSPLMNDESCQAMHYVEIMAGVERSEELKQDLRTNDDN